ncbi:hypothetical protein ABIA33_000669 [Streptacidiphilus sp. MAP12-16]
MVAAGSPGPIDPPPPVRGTGWIRWGAEVRAAADTATIGVRAVGSPIRCTILLAACRRSLPRFPFGE